jgi:membrane associated rhomboid family serine protease/antitoxin component YwqK of YwqJK toxin-antitoxin module
VITFAWLWWKADGFGEPLWTHTLLDNGALFNPLTLGGQWYRVFFHLFFHGNIIHLVLNMVVLVAVGYSIEVRVGTLKFLTVYFLAGIAGAFLSMYWNLFTVGVGASGALFGLLGFAFVLDLHAWRTEGRSPSPILVTLLFVFAINLLFGEELRVDNAAHIGGLLAGIILALIPLFAGRPFHNLTAELIIVPVMIGIWMILPRYQVTYFEFYQQVLHTQDSIRRVLNSNTGSDEEFVVAFKKANTGWDSALHMLDAHIYLPPPLHSDTIKMRKYIRLNKLHGQYWVNMVENESYIWTDSMAAAEDALARVGAFDYMLNTKYTAPDSSQQEDREPPGELAKVFYDSNWVELPYPPGVFHRIGYRDSLNRWQGPVRDYYGNGDVQMKGTYKDDKQDGIFIYYSDHRTYESAGRYQADRRVGKWENYHDNGRLESEVYYADRYFLKNYWDSTGVQMVINGNGTEEHRYPNNEVALHGGYVDGYQHGYWYGKHANGQMYFEEEYFQGRLIRGRARSLGGQSVTYDGSTFFALPVGGFQKLNTYLKRAAKEVNSSLHGSVKISFRVTESQQLADIKVERSLSPHLDEQAKRILLTGPKWMPAKLHGLEPIDGYGEIVVEY